jgi:hypothetical protein
VTVEEFERRVTSELREELAMDRPARPAEPSA